MGRRSSSVSSTSETSSGSRSKRCSCCSTTCLSFLVLLCAIFVAFFVPDLTHNAGDITLVERVVNFFVWIPVTLDHFIFCTVLGGTYYSVDFNENPYSPTEGAFYLAERVRLMMHADDSYHASNPSRIYDMPFLDASEVPFDDMEAAQAKFREVTNNYFKPFVLRGFANKTILERWGLRNLARNYWNESVTQRQWEGGCELGHIDKTYSKALACERRGRSLKSTIEGLAYEKNKWGMAHTVIPSNTAWQQSVFEDFGIDRVFGLFSFFNVSVLDLLPQVLSENEVVRSVFDFFAGFELFAKIKINMFDEMTALFLTPTYWDESAVRYKPETEALVREFGENDAKEFRRRQGAQLHNAFLGNIFVNVEGRKVWQFISPEYSIYLRPISVSYGFATFSFIQYYLFRDYFGYNGNNLKDIEKYYNVDETDYKRFKEGLFNGEYEIVDLEGEYERLQKFSSFKHLRQVYESIPKYEIMLEEGDMIYFPPFWWHGVKNYETAKVDEFDYAQPVNFAVANRLIFGLKALQLNYYDWVHSISLFSFKQVKSLVYGVEVRMHDDEIIEPEVA